MSVKERPILFAGSMVRGILEGRKTKTRRIMKPQPDAVEVHHYASGSNQGEAWDLFRCFNPPERFKPCASGWSVPCPGPFNLPGKPGDRLWVRETFGQPSNWCTEDQKRYLKDEMLRAAYPGRIRFRADDPTENICWSPSIHMPRWASRITLEIVSVRVERLQNISEEDAAAEGVRLKDWQMENGEAPETYREAFRLLWESINGPGSWDANPFVWVVEFKRIGGAA